MQNTIVYCLHGFLGNSSDWDLFKKKLKPNVTVVAPSLFANDTSSGNSNSLKSYLEIDTKVFNNFKRKIFVGYSLGGRLGLNILKNYHYVFDYFIFISTNPGFAADQKPEREKRIVLDEEWAQKISKENWNNFLSEWNEQPVFESQPVEEILRNADEYNLNKLQQALREFSLAKQPDFRDTIELHKNKIFCIVAKHDSKYLQISQKLLANKQIEKLIHFECGHRVHMQKPVELAGAINNLITD